MANDPIEIIVNIPASSGGASDNKVKITGTDTTADYLDASIDEGEGINLSILNSGADESIQVSSETVQVVYPFDYTTSSPADIYSADLGDIISSVKLYIDTLFDGTVTISIGESGSIERLMGVDENDPYDADGSVFEVEPGYEYPGAETIRLYLNVSGTTQGVGRVIMLIKKL